MNKPAVIVSAFLSAIVLAILGGVIYTARSVEPVQAIQAEQTPTVDPNLAQELLAREAEYRELIARANALLAEQQQVATTIQASKPTADVLQVTPEQAAVLASNYLGQTQIFSVEGVNLDGKSVYKVTFSSGDVVYVSFYGEILSMEFAPHQSSSKQTIASYVDHEDDYEHDHEHEERDDD